MSDFDDPGYEVWIEGAVQLNLDVPQVRVTIDGGIGLSLGVGVEARGCLKRTVAIDQSGLPNARADGAAVLPLILKMLQVGHVVPHIANCSYAASYV